MSPSVPPLPATEVPEPFTPPESSLYRANGLVVRSAIRMPIVPLAGAGSEPVAEIRYGRVPEELTGTLISVGPRSVMARDELLLEIQGLARYWVHEGRTAVVEPWPGSEEEDVRVFVQSSVMAALAHQNGLLPMHASAVEVDGGCVLFMGGPGSGKSTLAAALYRQGRPLVAEDMSVVEVGADGVPVVHPGYRHLKLWQASLDAVGLDPAPAVPTRAHPDKYSVRLEDGLCHRPLPLRKLYLLASSSDESITFTPVRGRGKLDVIRRETYRRKFIVGFGNERRHFMSSAAVAGAAPMSILSRPCDLGRLAELVERIEEDLAASRSVLT